MSKPSRFEWQGGDLRVETPPKKRFRSDDPEIDLWPQNHQRSRYAMAVATGQMTPAEAEARQAKP